MFIKETSEMHRSIKHEEEIKMTFWYYTVFPVQKWITKYMSKNKFFPLNYYFVQQTLLNCSHNDSSSVWF